MSGKYVPPHRRYNRSKQHIVPQNSKFNTLTEPKTPPIIIQPIEVPEAVPPPIVLSPKDNHVSYEFTQIAVFE